MKIKPGRYLMRNGEVATITNRDPDDDAGYPWEGDAPHVGHDFWMEDGGYSRYHSDGKWDLVKRLPDAKPAKPKAKAAKFGCWIPCKSRSVAREIAALLMDTDNVLTMEHGVCTAGAKARRLP